MGQNRRWLLFLLFVVGSWGGGCRSSGAGWVPLKQLSEQALQKAAGDQVILVEITSSYCSACRLLERQLAQDEVQSALASFPKRVLSLDDEGLARQVQERWGIGGAPHLLAVDGQGRIVSIARGQTAANIIRWVKTLKVDWALCGGSQGRPSSDSALSLKQRLEKGLACERLGRRELSLELLRKVAEQDPDNTHGVGAQALLALIQQQYLRPRQKNHAVAQTQLNDLIQRFSQDPVAHQARFYLAETLFAQDKDEEASRQLTDWAQTGTEHHHACRVWLSQGDTARALWHAGQAVQLEPQEARFWHTLAMIQACTGERKSAIESAATAARLAPDNEMSAAIVEELKKDLKVTLTEQGTFRLHR